MRRRILVLNQYYRPGVEATAKLLADLCEALAEDYDVTVVTGRLFGQPDLGSEEELDGVRVLRTRSTSFDRAELVRRGVNYTTYLGDTILRASTLPSPDLVVCMTDPPVVGNVALLLAHRYRAPLLVISQDVFPEIATELGRLSNPVAIGLLRRLVGYYLKRADHVTAIGERMKERLIAKGAAADRVAVIPNWVDTTQVVPGPHDTEWSREQGLAGKFTVMHSGNIGHAQSLDTLVRATTFLRDLDNLVVPIIGVGARSTEVTDLRDRLEADCVRFLPYQPREHLSESLGAAHIHYVGLAKGLSGFVVPSRVYGILAAGRPVIAAADADSETATLVAETGCGVVISPDRPDLLAAVVRDAYDGKLDLEQMGARGREYVTREADRNVAIGRYRALVASLIA